MDLQQMKALQTEIEARPKPNPCLELYGVGPDDTKCKTCAHLISFKQNKTWHKCELRKISKSVTTDHKVNWQACGQYQEVKNA